jgi:hypothetical protein
LLRTTVHSKSISKGDLGVGGAGGYAYASFVNDVNAAAQEDKEERQLGATNQRSIRLRRRVVESLSEHCDERTLNAMSEMVREALGQRRTSETGGESKSILVRNPSFGRTSLAARQIESEGVGTEGDTMVDTSLNAVGTTAGESKGSDGDEAARGSIAASNQEFFQHQRKGKERADAEAAQEKPDTQHDNPMMQQQQQRQHRLAAAVVSYDVFDTAERTVPPGGGKDTQYGNPMMQQHQQPAWQAEEAETAEEESGRAKHLMIREQMNAAGGRGQDQGGARGGARGGGVQPLNVDAVARSTSIVFG